MESIIVKLAGVVFENGQENIKKFGCEDINSFALMREPKNPHDPNAIRVHLGGIFLGYVPRPISKELAPQMDAGKQFIAFFVKLNKHPNHERIGLTVRIEEVRCVEAA
jgi:hypothetical protein